MRKHLKGRLLGILAAVMTFSALNPSIASADMGNYNFVSIEAGAVDSITVNGVTVEALYKPYGRGYDSDQTYCCAALVHRFYSQVYGRSVSNLNNTASVPCIDQGSFSETAAPKVGDVLRDNYSVHWAIVKEVNGNTVTLIQQNAWNGSYTKAWVGATVQIGDPRYTFFTWDGNQQTAGAGTAAGNYAIEYTDQEIGQINAVVHAKVSNPNRVQVTQVGCRLWDAKGTLLKEHVENCQRQESRFNMWYEISAELGVTLTPATAYSYQFFVMENGTEHPGEVQTFTTQQGPAKETDSRRTSEERISDAILLMQTGVKYYAKDELEDIVGVPAQTSDTAYYFNMETLFEKTGWMTFEMAEGSDVTGVRWEYTYGNGSEENLQHSETFYNDIVKVAKKVFGKSGKGICTNPDNMTMTWKGQGKVERNLVNGVPVVSVYVFE
ncbi:hypothetical protein [Ruminococcus gauvreauii]|uniref:hypothetical protein n=1 Tax=Ruminococcus gauvreauii TaxID=438033 RepID=UPI00398440E7